MGRRSSRSSGRLRRRSRRGSSRKAVPRRTLCLVSARIARPAGTESVRLIHHFPSHSLCQQKKPKSHDHENPGHTNPEPLESLYGPLSGGWASQYLPPDVDDRNVLTRHKGTEEPEDYPNNHQYQSGCRQRTRSLRAPTPRARPPVDWLRSNLGWQSATARYNMPDPGYCCARANRAITRERASNTRPRTSWL